MTITIYRDNLIPYGLCTEEECINEGNLAEIEVPVKKVKFWYNNGLREFYKMSFLEWYYNESCPEDFEVNFLGWAMRTDPAEWKVNQEQ